jgi:hypothetical protein
VGVDRHDEAAHVRPLAVVGKINVHVDRRDRILGPVGQVENLDRMAQTFYAHFIDGDTPCIFFTLFILHANFPGLMDCWITGLLLF